MPEPIEPFSATSEALDNAETTIKNGQPMGPDTNFQIASQRLILKGLETISRQLGQLTGVQVEKSRRDKVLDAYKDGEMSIEDVLKALNWPGTEVVNRFVEDESNNDPT